MKLTIPNPKLTLLRWWGFVFLLDVLRYIFSILKIFWGSLENFDCFYIMGYSPYHALAPHGLSISLGLPTFTSWLSPGTKLGRAGVFGFSSTWATIECAYLLWESWSGEELPIHHGFRLDPNFRQKWEVGQVCASMPTHCWCGWHVRRVLATVQVLSWRSWSVFTRTGWWDQT